MKEAVFRGREQDGSATKLMNQTTEVGNSDSAYKI